MTTVGVRPFFIRTSNGSGTTQDTLYTRRKHSRGAQEVWSALSRSSPVRYARGSILYLQPRELQNVRSNSDPADIGLQCVLCVLTSYFKQEDTQHTVCLAGSTLSQVEPSLCSDLAHCPVQEAIFVLQVLEQSAAPRLTLPQSCVSQYCGSLYVRCQLRSAGSSRTRLFPFRGGLAYFIGFLFSRPLRSIGVPDDSSAAALVPHPDVEMYKILFQRV